ncbi:MAG TPA: DoxX family protein [Acidimicrobiales bacterium]|nr:DoxX family protein [Acidimicrobiales bacterium]
MNEGNSGVTHQAVAFALAAFRISVASVMLAHGLNHIFGGGKIAGTAGWFESLGMRPGRLHAWLASLTEVGSGVLLALGLLTPIAGAGVVGVMLVAWIANHRGHGFFIFRPGEGWEYVMILTVAGLALATVGPGTWSLDRVLGLERLWGATGLWISVGAGGGGAMSLLGLFWRPVRVPEKGAAT